MNKKQQIIFDLLMAVHEDRDCILQGKGKNKRTVTVNAKQAKILVNKSLTAHFAVPDGIGSMVSPGAPPVVDQGAPIVSGIDAIFKRIALNPNSLDWEVSSVDTPYTFDEIAPGGRIKFARLYGNTITARCKLYGIGLDIPFETIYGKRFYQFLQGIDDAMDARNRKWSEVHYGLLKGAATTVQNYSGKAGSTVVRDVETINDARIKLIKGLKGVVARPLEVPLVLNCHFALEDRLNRALKTLITANDNDDAQITDKVQIFYTENDLDVNTGILSFPQRKSQNAVIMDAEQNTWRNTDTNGVKFSVFSMFGAVIGDKKEHIKVNFA